MTNMPYFPHFHGRHITISPTHYHSRYIKTKKTMNCATLLTIVPLHHLTTTLHEKQFTIIVLNQTLNRFVAQKANRLFINHYDHAIARSMEETL